MITTLIILGILAISIIGLVLLYNKHKNVVKKIDFANEYRDKFVDFANKYFKNHNNRNKSGNFDGEQYVWLTMNVSKIQNNLGNFGIMDYIGPFQTYTISNYQIVINTIPKFRDGSVQNIDVSSVDDSLLRFIGYLNEYQKVTIRNLRNPIIWFREGITEILSIPIFIFSWFGIISNRTLNSIKDSLIYKIISGLIAFVMFISGIVTIIVGYDESMEFLRRIFPEN